MSKPNSGHFSGTTGDKKASSLVVLNKSKHDIMTSKLNGLDTREHPTKYKQLSSKKLKALRKKESQRTITKEEYKHKEWQRRLDNRRRKGIDSFWEMEAELINRKLPTTRNWSDSQKNDILIGKRPKFNNITMQSHHTYSVAKYPHLANIGYLIYPVTKAEHKHRWHGNNYKNSLPGIPLNPTIKEDF